MAMGLPKPEMVCARLPPLPLAFTTKRSALVPLMTHKSPVAVTERSVGWFTEIEPVCAPVALLKMRIVFCDFFEMNSHGPFFCTSTCMSEGLRYGSPTGHPGNAWAQTTKLPVGKGMMRGAALGLPWL